MTQLTQENLDIIPDQVKIFQVSSKEELNSISFLRCGEYAINKIN